MARIPLRPIPAGHAVLTAEPPLPWATVFGREAPLELEIGCGAGGFALEHCRRSPQLDYVAFEWRKKFAREVAHRAERAGLTNLLVVEGDAREQVPRLFGPASLDAIHLQFPDPWWKRVHLRRAILQPEFTRLLWTRLRPGGRFDFRTDVEDRARQGLAVLEAAGFQNPQGAGTFHSADPLEVPSTRERRYLVLGQPVFRARLVRP
jgi:tRNA (guanine-N7-)-methyltransferase